jgi:hypothetical protein
LLSLSRRVSLFASRIFLLVTLSLFFCGLAWDFSTKRYLKGFADAIVPLQGSPEQKTEALAEWFRHAPLRNTSSDPGFSGLMGVRDPVTIVQDARLLKVCGTASNAFTNLAEAAGLKTRRLLLLHQTGYTMHVVVEVWWGDRWVVVDPQQGLIFRDRNGRGLSKEQLRNPEVFRDAISRLPGYYPGYTFERTVHVHFERIPVLGAYVRRTLNRSIPGWKEAANWGYLLDRPPLVLMIVSFLLLSLAILNTLRIHLHARRAPESSQEQMRSGSVPQDA